MSSRIARIVQTIDVLSRLLAMSVGVVVVLTVIVISYGVAARELFHWSDVWVTESTTYLMGYMTFVGSATLAWEGRHLKVDVLHHLVGLRARHILDIVSCTIVTAVAVVLACLAFTFWSDAWTSNEKSWGMLSLPLWIPYLSLAVGSILLASAQMVRLFLLVRHQMPESSSTIPSPREAA